LNPAQARLLQWIAMGFKKPKHTPMLELLERYTKSAIRYVGASDAGQE
jgi:hypothetical protein